MTLYTILSSGIHTREATDLSARLSAWHDAMVAHERRLRTRAADETCDEECPHAEARDLWADATALFGARAQGLTFLRSRAESARRPGHASETHRRLRDPRRDALAQPEAGALAAGTEA